MLEPSLESLCVLRGVTVYPGETFRFSVDLVLRKRRIVDPDLKSSLGGRFSDVFIVSPLGRKHRGQSRSVTLRRLEPATSALTQFSSER